MDFSLNDTQMMLADSIDKFIENDYGFEARQEYAASEAGFSRDVWRTFAELGWTAVPFSEADGGFDGGPIDTMVLMERFGRGLIVEPYLANILLAGGILKRAANEEQRARWLHPIIAGDRQAALAFVEPQARYDLTNVATAASAEGDEWIINGAKGYVLNGRNADLLIVPARTAGAQIDAGGITLFAVEAATSGVEIHDYPTVDGHQAAEVSFSDVRLDADNLLGRPGEAFAVLDATVDDATLAVCAEGVGIMQTLKDKTVEYSKNRIQFGVPIGSFQALQHRMVDMLTECEQSQSLLMWATMVNAAGEDDASMDGCGRATQDAKADASMDGCGRATQDAKADASTDGCGRATQDAKADAKRAISAIKYMIGTTGRKVGEEAVQIHGGMGVSWELDIAHYFKRLIAIGQIFGDADWHLDKLAA